MHCEKHRCTGINTLFTFHLSSRCVSDFTQLSWLLRYQAFDLPLTDLTNHRASLPSDRHTHTWITSGLHLLSKKLLWSLTRSSSMLVWHFSRLMRFMATFSFLGLQYAAWTTAVAPLPEKSRTTRFRVNQFKRFKRFNCYMDSNTADCSESETLHWSKCSEISRFLLIDASSTFGFFVL